MMRSLLLCGLLMAAAATASAQGASDAAIAPAQEELLALNFYVQQKDQPAITAELRRLQLKYPGWQAPADLGRLSVTAPSTEIDEMFRLIAAGQNAAARALIEETRTAFPDWAPPAEMLSLLDAAEGQARFDAALARNNLNEALSISAAVPELLRCDRINNAWRIAEAQAGAGRKADALGTYRAISSACSTPGDLIATLEKADKLASDAEIMSMIDQAATRLPKLLPELTTLRQRLMAGRGQPLSDAPEATATDGRSPAPAARAAASSKGAGNSAASAEAPRKSAPAAAAGKTAGAGGSAGSAGGSAFQTAVAEGDWSRCMALSAGARQASVIYQRGWCAYNLDQPMEAVTAFSTARKAGISAEQNRDASYGIALAYLKMQMPEEASRIAAATDFTRKQRIDIERQILDQRGVAAYKRRQYKQAIAYFDALEQLTGGIRRDLAVLRAYAWLNTGNRAEARRQFQQLNRALSTHETRRGLQATNN